MRPFRIEPFRIEHDRIELGNRAAMDLFAESLAADESQWRPRWCRYLRRTIEIARSRAGAGR
jgi:hypothetical protein